jgi:long-chain acyl-CoA synthetase
MTSPDTDLSPQERIAEALAQPSLALAFISMARSTPDRTALRAYRGDEQLTYGGWLERASAVAGGLTTLGVGKGDRVALLLDNGITFHVVDVAVLLLGAAAFSLYNTAPVEQLLTYIDNAEPTVLIAEPAYLERAREVVRLRPSIRLVVAGTGAGAGTQPAAQEAASELSLAALEASSPSDFDLDACAGAISPDDLLTLVYTSGTTGPPKGVQYIHGGVMFALQTVCARLPVSPEGRILSYLPMAHIAERLLGHYAGFVYGYEITPLPDPAQLPAALKAVRPTRFFGVPRMYEKAEAGMHDLIARSDPDHAAELRRAWEAGLARVRAAQPGGRLPAPAPEEAALLAELRDATGLGEAEWLGAAGAPVAQDLAERFHAVGLPINELWGMSESIIGCTCHPDDIRIGTAGLPFDGFEFKLGADGELLVRSPTVTPGYFRDPERTREAIDGDGWLHTGDIATIDGEGFVRIVGRKKELIINSAGKNMSPVLIEQAIVGGDPLVSFCVVFGDARPYNICLFVLDRQATRAFAAAEGLGEQTHAELLAHPRVREHLAGLVRAGNERLSRVEQVKRWTVLDVDWKPGSEELTLTSKLRRKQVYEKYAAQADALYARPREAQNA